jgi:hypothetical protein
MNRTYRVRPRLLLGEHFAEVIAERLRTRGHDVVAVVADPALRAQADVEVFRRAAAEGRWVVTENVKDFRPLLLSAYDTGEPVVALLLVPSGRFPRGGRRAATVVSALEEWLTDAGAGTRSDEDWLT